MHINIKDGHSLILLTTISYFESPFSRADEMIRALCEDDTNRALNWCWRRNYFILVRM